jgi:hypothetical protein
MNLTFEGSVHFRRYGRARKWSAASGTWWLTPLAC